MGLQAQTTNQPVNFDTVSIEAWTGWQYKGQTSESTAILGAAADLGSFSCGKLGVLDYGLSTEMTIGNSSSTVQATSIRAELIKNISDTQIKAFAGGGRDFDNGSWYVDFGTELNYQLIKGKNWASYLGTGVQFRYRNASQMDCMPVVRTGIAF